MCSLTDVKCLSEPSVTSELYQPKQLMIRSCFWSAEPVFSDTATAECGNKEKKPWFSTDYVAVTRALSLNAKVLIYWSILTLFLFSTAVMRITSRIQALEKGFLWRVPRLNFGVSVAAPPHWNEPFEAVWASDLNSSWTPSYMTCFRHFLLRGGVVMDPGPAGEIISLSWIGNTSLSWTSRGRHGKISSLNLKQRKPVHSLVLISYNVTVDLSMWISHQIPFAFPFS